MFGMFKPKTTIEIREYGDGSKTTTSWGRTIEEGPRRILKVTTDDIQRDLPEISKLAASKSFELQNVRAIKPASQLKTISLLPEEKPAPKKGWF